VKETQKMQPQPSSTPAPYPEKQPKPAASSSNQQTSQQIPAAGGELVAGAKLLKTKILRTN